MANLSDYTNKDKEPTQWTSSSQSSSSDSSSDSAPSPTPSSVTSAAGIDEILASVLGQIKDIGTDSNLKLLVFGDPGSTKSSFVATAPNSLVYDTEDGLISAKSSPNGIADNVKTVHFESWDQLAALVGKLSESPKELEWVEVFALDTLSELHKKALGEITEREWRKQPSRNRFVAEVEHHTENNERILRLIRALREMKRDLIITTHAKTVEPKNKPAKTYSDFSESLANRISGFMDVAMHLEMRRIDGKITPVGRVVSDGTINAKNRIGLPEEIINPTFPQIKKAWLDAING